MQHLSSFTVTLTDCSSIVCGVAEALAIAWSRRMSQQQELLTDRLVHVISSIQRGRRSGVLTAKRGQGIALEEGTIVFANGQISQASVGRRRGSEALNWLSTWGRCRFMFVPASSEAGVHIDQPSLPAKGNATGPLALGPPLHTTNTPWPDPQAPGPSSPGGQEGTRRAGEGLKRSIDTPASAAPSPIQPLDVALRLIEQHGLSRVHRQLFCLVDGRRTIVEMVRLMRKRESEIYRLLGDLERAHVIRTS
jgi:hypothetical protein